MGREPARANADRPRLSKGASGAQHVELRLDREPIARLDLDSDDSFADERVEARQGRGDEPFDAQLPCGPDGGHDAAAGPCDRFIGRAFEPHLELARAVTAVNQMRVAVDESRRDPATSEILRRKASHETGRQIGFGSGIDDATRPQHQRAAIHAPQRSLAGHQGT